jgi:ABC-type transport system substrate-binding protein
MWSEIGVNVELVGLDHPVYTAERQENRDEYDFVMVHFGRDTDPNNFVQEVFHTSQFPPGSNAAYYDEVDDLIEAGASEPDLEAREAIYVELQQKIQEDVPGIPLVHTTACYAVRNEIAGFEAPVHTGFAAFPLSPSN